MSWSIEINNETYSLDNLADIGVDEFDGVGMAPIEYFTEQGAQQNGGAIRGYRLRPRTIQMILWSVEKTPTDYWAKRESLLRMFRPGLPIELTKTYPNTITRTITGYMADGMTLGSRERKNWTQRVGISIYCPNPLWRSASVPETLWDTWTVGVPATKSLNLTYRGSADEYPVISIYPERTILGVGLGAMVDPVITNAETGDVLDFTGYTIAAGHVVEIDCRYGYKTVVDYDIATPTVRTNIIDKLSADSDLTSFRLVASEDGTDTRVNQLTLEATATSGTETDLDLFMLVDQYYRFLGI